MPQDWLNTLFPENAERTLPWPEALGGPAGETVTLFRPTGLEELGLFAASSFTRYPPRLPDQPIFYPVLNFEYAEEIARDWNAARSGVGFVTRFEVRSSVALEYPVQIVGSERRHLELWVPAEEQERFQAGLNGPIEVVAHYTSLAFTGQIDPRTHLPLEGEGGIRPG